MLSIRNPQSLLLATEPLLQNVEIGRRPSIATSPADGQRRARDIPSPKHLGLGENTEQRRAAAPVAPIPCKLTSRRKSVRALWNLKVESPSLSAQFQIPTYGRIALVRLDCCALLCAPAEWNLDLRDRRHDGSKMGDPLIGPRHRTSGNCTTPNSSRRCSCCATAKNELSIFIGMQYSRDQCFYTLFGPGAER